MGMSEAETELHHPPGSKKDLSMNEEKTDLSVRDLGDALIREAIAGNESAVEQLVASGADVDYLDANGVTALMAAAKRGHFDVMTLLLAKGACTSPTETSTGRTALMLACLSGNSQSVQLLQLAGADVNVRDAHRTTPLMMAAIRGDIEMVRTLVYAGAEIGNRDENGFSALDWAKKWRRNAVVAFLQSTGIRIWKEGGTFTGLDKDLPFIEPRMNAGG